MVHRAGAGTLLSPSRESISLRRAPRALILDALAFVLCLVMPALLALTLLSPADQLRQVIALHLAASRVLPLKSNRNGSTWMLLNRFGSGDSR